MQLLEWYEENVDVVEVLDRPDQLGISVVSPEQRIVLRRDGFDLLVLTETAEEEGLLSAVAGMLEIMGARELTHESSGATWSSPVEGDYAAACRALAGRAVGPLSEGLIAKDVAILADVTASTYQIQVEYGIVTGVELFDRLTKRELSRVQRDLPNYRGAMHAGFPQTAIFAETYWTPTTVGPITDVSDVLKRCTLVREQTDSLVQDMTRTLIPAGGQP